MTSYIYDMVDTWNAGATTFTAVKMNVTDTASASGSLLMDLQVGGSSQTTVSKAGIVRAAGIGPITGTTMTIAANTVFTGASALFFDFIVYGGAGTLASSRSAMGNGFTVGSGYEYKFSSTTGANGTPDLFLTRRAAANLRLGAADAAAPVAQTLSVQSGTAGASALSCSISGTTLTVGGAVTGTIAIGHAVTGTGVSAGTVITAGSGTTWTVNNSQTVSSTTMYFNSVGQNLTITGSQGSGPSAGGSIVFQVAPAGSAGTTAQNALITGLTVRSVGTNNAGIFTPYLPNVGDSQSVIHGTSFGSTGNGPWVSGTQNGAYTISRMTTQSSGSIYFYTSSGNEIVQVFGTLGLGGIIQGPNVFLHGEATNTLALRNGANAQAFRVYNTTDGTNSEFGKIAWSSNVLQIGTEKAGTGTARALEFQTNGNTRLTLGATGLIFTAAGDTFYFRATSNTATGLNSPSDGVLTLADWNGTNFNRLQFGGTTSSFPALKRSSTTLQARLADDSAFASVQGKLTTDTAYAAGDPTTTGYLVVYDSTGTAYKIPAVAV